MNYIVQPRILPKVLSKGIINREKPLKKIAENFQKSVILVCAPAGYGKTTLLLHFLNRSSRKFSWLNVKRDMDNFYTFMTYLVHSLKQLNPEFGTATQALVNDYIERFQLAKNLKRITGDITGAFINEFCNCFREDIIIVIDDLENIENSEWLTAVFNTIFENIPQNMHFIIMTRQIPEFNFGMLLAKRNLLKITADDLVFQKNEIEELLSNVYNIKCSGEDIKVLKDKSGGWITGLHLILQSYGSKFKDLHLDKIIILEDIFNYFTEDIFNNLGEGVRDFLLKTSLLNSFTQHLCDELLGITDSRNIINELLSKNIFIQINFQESSDKESSYSYQSLFRKFLNTKLYELKPKKEVQDFLKDIYEYYLGKKDYVKAINYALELEDFDSAVPLIKENFQKYFDEGNFELLWNWFEKLGETTIEQNPYLLHCKSLMLRFYKGSIEESMPYIDRAIELSEERGDTELLVKCIILKSGNLLTLGKISEAISHLDRIIDKKMNKQSRLLLLYRLAYAYYLNSDYDKSMELLNKAINELSDSDMSKELKDTRLHIFNLYGHIFLIRGEFSKSISYYEQVAKNAEKLIDLFETYCNLVLLYAQSGKFGNASSYLSKAKEIYETVRIPIFRISYLLAQQALRFEYGDYEDSIKLLEELNEIAVKLNHKYYIYLSYSLIADSYYYLDKLSDTEEFLDIAFKYVNEASSMEKTQYAFMKALMLKKAETSKSIETVLLEVYNFYDTNKFAGTKAQVAFHLADYYFKENNLQTASTHLSEALITAKEKEYVSFLQREFMNCRYLFDFALANNIQKDFIALIKDSLINRRTEKWVSAECSKRIESLGRSFYDITLKSLGKGEILIRGITIPENNWSKKKWKLIFIYLLLNSKKGLTKDKIIDVFYPETPPESADNIFYQIISKFRNLIKISSEGEKQKDKKTSKELKKEPSLIEYEDGVLSLNRDLNYYIDADEFEKYYKLSTKENATEKKIEFMKKALGLYNGEFLEGNYETWCEELRTAYKSYFMLMSEELIKLLCGSGEYTDCIKYSENLLRYDKINLQAYEGLIKSYIRLDKYNLAKEKHSQLIQDYKKEYSEEPPIRIIKKIDMALSNEA
jgi:ATP/maltotriose-dependent transcriptional regulator MalT/DNA-binding SARP family transcriptional activator